MVNKNPPILRVFVDHGFAGFLLRSYFFFEPFLVLALASSISLLTSKRFLVFGECDFLGLPTPVGLFPISIFLLINSYFSLTEI